MDRNWFQLMCCTHSYDMQVCPIILEQLLETGVRQKSDRCRTEIRLKFRDGELVRVERYAEICE